MTQVVIYNQDNHTVAVIWPTPEALAEHGIDAVAKKDVPEGVPYKIIDSAELPSTRDARDAWVVPIANLTDGVGSAGNSF